MKKYFFAALFFAVISLTPSIAETKFGYISYHSYNIGDDIQAIAAKRFLPKNSIPIDREFISEFESDTKVSTIVNGWYMHTKDVCWYRIDTEAPEVSWPPAPSIDPLLISIHFCKEFLPEALADEGIEYLRQHAPVGARDYNTLEELQKRNIPSYFSGCLTLTLDNPYKKRRRKNVIYAVDINEECLAYLKKHANCPVKVINHGVPFDIWHDNDKRLKYAEKLLDKYRRAKCVITQRLHATMPCLAFETPVLLIGNLNYRFSGLKELVRHCTTEEFVKGEVDFNFNRPSENPKDYLPLRENLIEIVSEWVNREVSQP